MKKKSFKIFQAWRNKDELSFYNSLFLSFFIVTLTSTLLLTAFLMTIFFKSVSSSTKNYNQQLLAQTNYTVDQIQESIDLLTGSLLSNDNILAFLSLNSADNTNIPTLASREVNRQLIVLPYIDSIYLYNARLDLLYSSDSGYQLTSDSFKEQEIISRLHDKDFVETYSGKLIPSFKNSTASSTELLTYYIFDRQSSNNDNANAIVINVNLSMLTDALFSMKELTSETKSNFLLLDDNMSYLTSVLDDRISEEDTWVKSALKSISSKNNSDSPYIKIDGMPYLLTCTDQNNYGWNLFSFVPLHILFQDILTAVLFCFLIWTIILACTLLLCRHFAKQLNKPLETLAKHLSETHSKDDKKTFKSKEFRAILSAVSSLQKSNRQFQEILKKSYYPLEQSCLNELIDKRQIDSSSYLNEKLTYLKLDYLEKDHLCMIVFKIDRYQEFLSQHPADELWAIQFSVVNIIDELASADFKRNVFSRNDDKFVLLISCESEPDMVAFEKKLVLLLQSVQKNIEAYLHFTMTAAYSKIYKGLDLFPAVYRNITYSLLLKMYCGHEAIIDPYQIDNVLTESFQLSYKQMTQLTDCLINGQFENACSVYDDLTQNLFCYDYTEISSAMIHLVYSIYERFSAKYPMLQDICTNALKAFISGFRDAEVSDDVRKLSQTFFETFCLAVQKLKADPAQQNSAVIAEKIVQIIENQYTDPALCLTAIAEEIDLSSNYTGNIFKQHTQKSVAQYLLEVRMEKVAFYLQTTSLPMNKILPKVGLELNNYFYTKFKNHFGMSLSDYRKKFQIKDHE